MGVQNRPLLHLFCTTCTDVGKNMNQRQQDKHIRIKEMIIQGAKELIQENGYNRLSLRGIATRIGFAPASIYEYFTGKDDIIDTVCTTIDQKLASMLQETPDIIACCLAYIQFARDNADDFQLLYHRELLGEYTEEVPLVFLAKLTEYHQQHVALTLSMEVVSQAMWSTSHGLALLSLHRNTNVDTHSLVLETLLHGFHAAPVV